MGEFVAFDSSEPPDVQIWECTPQLRYYIQKMPRRDVATIQQLWRWRNRDGSCGGSEWRALPKVMEGEA